MSVIRKRTDYDVSPSPTTNDVEFKSSADNSGFTVLGTLNTNTSNTDRLSALHIANTATGVFNVHGLYKAIPAMPFTVTIDLLEMQWDSNYQRTALMIAETTPGKLFLFGPAHQLAQNINMGYTNWTNRTTRLSATDVGSGYRWQRYVRMVVTSSTSVALQGSTDGWLWKAYATVNPGFTIGNIGIGITGEDNSVVADAYVNWMRFGTNVVQPEERLWQMVGRSG